LPGKQTHCSDLYLEQCNTQTKGLTSSGPRTSPPKPASMCLVVKLEACSSNAGRKCQAMKIEIPIPQNPIDTRGHVGRQVGILLVGVCLIMFSSIRVSSRIGNFLSLCRTMARKGTGSLYRCPLQAN